MNEDMANAKFRRLFWVYVKLVNSETIALREKMFDVVEDLCERKAAIFSELEGLGQELGISREHPAFAKDFAALLEAQPEIAATSRADGKAERENGINNPGH